MGEKLTTKMRLFQLEIHFYIVITPFAPGLLWRSAANWETVEKGSAELSYGHSKPHKNYSRNEVINRQEDEAKEGRKKIPSNWPTL